MKCFLLELRVILHESRDGDINDTVRNLIILANSSLSSNGVSYPIVVMSYTWCSWLDWEKLWIDKQILLMDTKERVFSSSGVASKSSAIAKFGKQTFAKLCQAVWFDARVVMVSQTTVDTRIVQSSVYHQKQ